MPNREKITDSADARAIDEPIAGTAQGLPDDALLLGEELPEEPSDEDVARITAKLDAPDPNR